MAGDTAFWETHYKEHGNADQSPFTTAKNHKILEIIPKDVGNILDVGCGGGSLMIFLLKQNRFRVEGVDTSAAGVHHIVNNLKLKATEGSALDLHAFEDHSFDMVICSEVLEHIPVKDWETALKELRRVSKKYVLTTNPYKEKLRYHQVVCQDCDTRFNPIGHIHSIDERFIQENMEPYVDTVSIHYSGMRDWFSVIYSDVIRAMGLQMVNSLQVSCPICKVDVPYKQWGIPLKIINRFYFYSQAFLRILGLFTPATIICLSEKKNN